MRTDTCCIELEFWDSTIINSVIQYQVALQVFEILGIVIEVRSLYQNILVTILVLNMFFGLNFLIN